MSMKEIILTHLEPLVTVFSELGRQVEMKERKYYGVSLCLGGQITYSYEGKEYVSVPGTVLFLPKGGNYRLYGNREGTFPVLNFDCLRPPWEGMEIHSLQNEAESLQRFTELQELFAAGAAQPARFAAAYALLHSVTQKRAPLPALPEAASRLVRQHLSDPALDNTFLAEKLGISEVYLRKLFAAHLATSPRQYILSLRLSRACRLLEESQLPVAHLAAECGFASPYHFCRAFKKRTGLTPTEYARAHRIYKI